MTSRTVLARKTTGMGRVMRTRDGNLQGRRKGSPRSIELAIKLAPMDWSGFWVDTNCIDKTSSAELPEGHQLHVCVVCPVRRLLRLSQRCERRRRQARGPNRDPSKPMVFPRMDTTGVAGARADHLLRRRLEHTRKSGRRAGLCVVRHHGYKRGISPRSQGLRGGRFDLRNAPVARKMSWLAGGATTRIEDLAYCMLGLFYINMPLLYGEGTKAFTRLQHEITKVSNDHTIFCWCWNEDVPSDWTSILAHSPSQFRGCGGAAQTSNDLYDEGVSIYSMTNAGLSIRLPNLVHQGLVLPALRGHLGETYDKHAVLAIRVKAEVRRRVLHVSREHFPEKPVAVDLAITTRHGNQRSLDIKSLLVVTKPPPDALPLLPRDRLDEERRVLS